MKIKYKYRIYLYILGFFAVFCVLIYLFVISEYKRIKQETIEKEEQVYADMVYEFVSTNKLDSIGSLLDLLPDDTRISVFDNELNLLFDNYLRELPLDDSRSDRMELRKALIHGEARQVRYAAGTKDLFLFYAVDKGNYLIRIGIPFNEEMKRSISPSITFSVILILLFVGAFVCLTVFYVNLQKSIKRVKDHIILFRKTNRLPIDPLPDDELGEIGGLIIEAYAELEQNKKNTSIEREKLLEHFQHSEEGISFFSPERVNVYTNTYFIQYLNILLDSPTFDVNNLFINPVFEEIVKFIDNPGGKTVYNGSLNNKARHFQVNVIIFEDKSFEIVIRDISEVERNRMNKAEMSNNIAHELKTPVTSIRGYLETLLEMQGLPPEKQKVFLERAYKQSIRLSEIIQDVILITKTDDAPNYFTVEEVNIAEMMNTVLDETREKIQEAGAQIEVRIDNNVIVTGNYTLLASIFRNLLINALKYAGENPRIQITNYMDDENYYYFSFADNGKGIEDKHLPHIFKRFYRISEGRTRDQGGSGLGLSITRKAVRFHKGEIYAKNRIEGGLEFLFTLKKG